MQIEEKKRRGRVNNLLGHNNKTEYAGVWCLILIKYKKTFMEQLRKFEHWILDYIKKLKFFHV